MHQAVTHPDSWGIIREIGERLCKHGVLVDTELAPYCNAAQAAGRRWGFLKNL